MTDVDAYDTGGIVSPHDPTVTLNRAQREMIHRIETKIAEIDAAVVDVADGCDPIEGRDIVHRLTRELRTLLLLE